MTARDTSAPAFPQPQQIANDLHPGFGRDAGMTLRDFFAAKAMAALIMHANDAEDVKDAPIAAYAVADLMLKAREA